MTPRTVCIAAVDPAPGYYGECSLSDPRDIVCEASHGLESSAVLTAAVKGEQVTPCADDGETVLERLRLLLIGRCHTPL